MRRINLCVIIFLFKCFSGRSYGYGKKMIKKDILPVPPKKHLPIGGGNIGFDRWQDNRNWQNGGNWGDGDFINQRQHGGFVDNFQNQNLDFLNQGQGGLFNGRFGNGFNRNRFQNQQFGNQW